MHNVDGEAAIFPKLTQGANKPFGCCVGLPREEEQKG